jgi:dTDP-4-amino-4,6-dideoxygalactose transaminase
VGDLILPSAENSKVVPVYHLFVIRSKYRERLRDWLAEKSVESGIHYPVPIHLQPIYKQLFKGKVNPLPNTEELSSTCLSLPLYPSMVDGEVKYVAKSMIEFFENIGK